MKSQAQHKKRTLIERFLKPRVGGMLVRNTVASTAAFVLGLGAMWLLVTNGGMNEVLATGVSFMIAQSLHYILGRSWVFEGTTRSVGKGYAIFLANAVMGLGLTVSLFALLTHLTALHFITARIIVSIFAGLAMFVVNATINFERV